MPVTPTIGRLRFEEAAQDLQNDYRSNGKRSLDEVTRRIDKQLAPTSAGGAWLRSPVDIRSYVAERQAATSITFKGYEVRRNETISDGLGPRPEYSVAIGTEHVTRRMRFDISDMLGEDAAATSAKRVATYWWGGRSNSRHRAPAPVAA